MSRVTAAPGARTQEASDGAEIEQSPCEKKDGPRLALQMVVGNNDRGIS